MSNRFDDMMVQGINTNDATAMPTDILEGKTAYAGGQKITGTLVPSGGTGDLNVFVQTTEPTKKEGLWIKESKTDGNVFVSALNTKKGNFIDSEAYSFLKATDETICHQAVVGDWLYSFGIKSNSQNYCRKYNLRTKQSVPISTSGYLGVASSNVQNMSVYNPDKNKIYLFTLSSYLTIIFTYNIDTDTYTTLINDSYNKYAGGKPHIYKNLIYFPNGAYYDMESSGSIVSGNSSYRNGMGDGIGNISYYFNNRALMKLDHSTNTRTTLMSDVSANSPEPSYFPTAMFLKGNYIYIFYGAGILNLYNANFYSIYDITNNSIQFVSCETYYTNTYYTSDVFAYDEANGLLHLREKDGYLSIMQFDDNNQIGLMENGDILITQDATFNNPAQLISNPNITIGVRDTFIKINDELDNVHPAYWGDGSKWNIFKNPTNETCTVTFDLAGGTGTIPSQTIVAGTSPTEPSTNPSKTGEIFDKWYIGNEPFDFSMKISTDTTLTAHYIAYQEIAYIQSTGTQYIDTGVKPTASIKSETEYRVFDVSRSNNTVLGCYATNNTNRYQFRHETNYFCGWGSSYLNSIASSTSIQNRIVTIENGVFSIDNSRITTISSSFDSNTVNIYLFAINANNAANNFSSGMRIYSCKIYDNGTLIRDFQPIMIPSTDEYCMIDKVENKLYHNKGSGKFIGEGYEPTYLDYIESTGTQYIDTGFKPNQNTEIQVNGKNISDYYICGVGKAGTYTSCGILLHSSGYYGGRWRSGSSTNETILSSTQADTQNHIFKVNKTGFWIDNTSIGTFSSSYNFQETYSIYLFAMNVYTSALCATTIIKNAKIYDNGTLVRDFVPVLDYNDVPCLWDKVTESFYYNAGTGTFNYGEVVNNG